MEENNNLTKIGASEPQNTKEGFVIDESALDLLEENEPQEAPTNLKKEVFEWLEVLTTAIITVVVIFSLIFRIATIDGNSMLNTLHDGEKVLITNFLYTAKRGDIVVISRNTNNTVEDEGISELPIIKRVIAVGGDTVDIDFDRGVVIVNGVELDEPYAHEPTTQQKDVQFPVYVPQGYIFVLGDHRADSLDSRTSYIGENGLIDERYVLGHAFFRIFPFAKMGGI